MARAQWCAAASDHFVPRDRVLFGADDSRGYTGPDGIETQMGRTMGVRNRHWSHGAAVKQIGQTFDSDASAGAIPMVSLGGQGYTPQIVQNIATGKEDSWWSTLFATLGRPGLFRPWMEMNGGHNAYSSSAAHYVAMWQHVHALYMQHGHGNLTWIFCPQIQDPSVEPWQKFWPGDGAVDWMGYDLYRHFFSAADEFRLWGNQHHKPFTICESGFEQGKVVHDTATSRRGDKDGTVTGLSLIRQTRADIAAHPNTVMYLVWNNHGPGGTDYIDTSRASLQQYREFATDPRFQFAV
jgi:hypothetical protein